MNMDTVRHQVESESERERERDPRVTIDERLDAGPDLGGGKCGQCPRASTNKGPPPLPLATAPAVASPRKFIVAHPSPPTHAIA
ncbi:hypothetical protein V9T40_013117 [Parthenolecanium corni]|uniref:Uncharacterized protein n=1 Tax=Parthenolecanium corni TaxID=536013 RepID=A0AAN9TJ96_9HEMI